LLIACANVANLLLIRATARQRQLATRSALGAGRGHIIRQLLTESLAISLVGGLLGLIIGFVGVRLLLAISPGGIPRIGPHGSAVNLDGNVLLFTVAVSILTGIFLVCFLRLAVRALSSLWPLRRAAARPVSVPEPGECARCL